VADPGEARAGTLYVVATPIGNLEDVTLRAVRVLGEVDLVAAEDTRRTRLLLDHLGLHKRLVSYYDAVESSRAPELVRRLLAGESIALVSDAGTPLVADPGFRLVRAASEAGVAVVSLPGASAPLALLACSGLPTVRFSFVGFLPPRSAARRREIAALAGRTDTLVFFESPRRLVAALADLAAILGPRAAVVGRELTKKFEEIVRGDLSELTRRFAERAEKASLKGEIAIAVAGVSDDVEPSNGMDAARVDAANAVAPTLDERLLRHLGAGESVSDAARAVAAETGLARRNVYRRALELRGR
jgi:16S rRNA (cytidine1402-2'-O)-methyltransferase